MASLCYRRHRFPPEVLQHAIWLYLRFTLSYRDAEELLAERGLDSVYELLKNPGLRDWLEQDWSRTEQAVEEFLRFVTPVQFTKPRFVRKNVELGGVRLKKGDKVMPMLTAANLDPQAYEHPEKLDFERRPNRHLAFGAGIHFCLGHQLARIEGACALKALFRRWPKLELAVDESLIKWRRRPGLRAIEQLPVRPVP
jgi:cytochrome P450